MLANEPWDIKPDDARELDSLPTFIIFCEDDVSEPIYFKFFETEKIKVNPIKNQKSMMVNVVNAIDHCKEHDLMEFKDGCLCAKSDGTQIWCVYDRDKEETDEKIRTGNILFDESINTAVRNNINVAWSNDSFELWILLHFEDVDVTDSSYKQRTTYYDRLTEIFKNYSSPSEYLTKILAYSGFNYKTNLKSEKSFRYVVRPLIVQNTAKAIDRAKVLETHFNSGEHHKKAPCTLMHHLVEELLRLGGKENNLIRPIDTNSFF